MFKFCAITSFLLDVVIIVFFMVHPHLVEDKPSADLDVLLGVEHSFFPFILFAGKSILMY